MGTYSLAKSLCDRPLLATLMSISTPVFLLSGTTVMCDILMLSFWVSAVNLWRKGIKLNSIACLASASLCITACGLTKYYGISLIPLLFAYALAEKRKLGSWVFHLLIPVLLLAGYQLMTHALYGRDHIVAAASFALSFNNSGNIPFITKSVTGLAFIGGCLFTSLCYAPILWRKALLVIVCLIISLGITLLLNFDFFGRYPIATSDGINWLFVVQVPVFILSGLCFVVLACNEFWRKRDADSLLIVLWIFGTIIFAMFVNWTVNGRSILPVVPVTGVLIVRALERRSTRLKSLKQWQLYGPLVPAFIVALLVTWSDCKLANSSRDATYSITKDFSATLDKLWFQGHWGFQYYMQLAGSKAVDFESPHLSKGDFVVIPSNNAGLKVLHKHMATLIREYEFGKACLLTMNETAGAGFYTDLSGGLPLPFAIGHTTGNRFYVFQLIRDKYTRFTY
jgi:hypothetical protein